MIRKQIKAEQESFMKDLQQDEIESPRPLETDGSSDTQLVSLQLRHCFSIINSFNFTDIRSRYERKFVADQNYQAPAPNSGSVAGASSAGWQGIYTAWSS